MLFVTLVNIEMYLQVQKVDECGTEGADDYNEIDNAVHLDNNSSCQGYIDGYAGDKIDCVRDDNDDDGDDISILEVSYLLQTS